MPEEKNPLSDTDKKNFRLPPDVETDKWTKDEEKYIVDIVLADKDAGISMMSEWIEFRRKDIQMYEGARPSEIENLSKESWQADRNLGLCAATCDTYQAVLLSTCYNPDTLHFIAGQENDIDRRNNLEKFTKWMVGKQEVDCEKTIDDYIHNKITQGIGCMKVYWHVWYEWVDLRIPKYNKDSEFAGYDINTEYRRFEKAQLENIANLEDIIVPTHGDTLQKKRFIIHILHKDAEELTDESSRDVYSGIDDDYIEKMRGYVLDSRVKVLGEEKAKELGLVHEQSLTSGDYRNTPVDILEWYGTLTIKGKTEKYRATVDPCTSKLIALKPLRKITRSGKVPFIGGAFIRRPGFWQGKSMPWLIAPICNAFNNVFNQKSDFQYVQNVPFGFFKPDENFQKQQYKIKPGDLYPTDNPQDVYFPNLSRSLAWAESDFRILFECLEKLTGAASYFMSAQRGSSTSATRDAIISQKSETRFGLWVDRTIDEICEAITMLLQFYQDWAPSNLGERVLGEKGEKLFERFSIESIRGAYDARLTPDFISGSKQMERQLALWGVEFLANSVWFNPQMNPKGSWQLHRNAAYKMGMDNIDSLMPPEPKADYAEDDLVKAKWSMIAQGEIPELNKGEDAQKLVIGLESLKQTKLHDLDEEYRPNLDAYIFRLSIAAMEQMKQQMQDIEANKLAMAMVQRDQAMQRGEVANGVVPQQGMPSGAGSMGESGNVGGMGGNASISGQQGSALPTGSEPPVTQAQV